MPLDAVLDHVAVAVPDIAKAEARWRDQLGGARVGGRDEGVFATGHLRFTGGGDLELLAPSPSADSPTFVHAFLDRFGSRIHHVTLKVRDLPAAIAELEGAGLDVVDVDLSHDDWREAFLRPSQVGGLVVQVAYTPPGQESLALRMGQTTEEPAPDAGRLHGPTLGHPDLDRARELWSLLGATVATTPEGLRCTWPDSPLDVVIVEGEGGPISLRMSGTPPLGPEAGVGPAVTTAGTHGSV